MSDQLGHYQEHGYRRDREQRLRDVAGDRDCLSLEAANQIKHLKSALTELISVVEIHSSATSNNFAWAELEDAKTALAGESLYS